MDDEKPDRMLTTTSTFAESTYGSGSEELPSPSDWSSRYRRPSDYSYGSSLPRDVFRAPPTQYAVFRNFDERSSDHVAGSFTRPLISDDTTSLILETQRAIRVTRLANEEAAARDRETHARFMEASKENAWKISENAARVMDRNSNLEMEIARVRADFLQRNEERQNDLIQRDTELLKKTAELEALRAQIRGLDVELDCLRSQPLESSGEDVAMLAEQLARKDAQVALLDAQTTQLRNQLLDANDLKETLSHAGSNAVNVLLQRLEKSREESSSTVIQLQVTNAELLDGKRTAENLAECHQREVQSLRASVEQLQRALQDSNQQFEQLVSDWQRERTELSVEVGEATVKVDLWEGQNEILKSENRGLRNQLAEHQEFSQLFRTLNDENVRLRSRVADCVQVRESLDVGVQKALEAAQSQVAALREQLAMAKNDRTDRLLGDTDGDALTTIREAYETRFQTLQTTLTLDSEASMKNLQLQLDQYKELYEAVVGGSSSSAQQGRDAETEARIRVELQREVESFKTLQRKRLENYYQDTGERLSTVVADLMKTGQRQTQQLDAQTKQALADMRSTHLAEMKQVKNAFDASVTEIIKQSESRLANQLDDFNRVANEARTTQKQLVEQTSHLRSAVEEKQALITRLEGEVTSMKPLTEELSELKKQLQAKTCEVNHLKSRVDHESERARESGKVEAYQQYMVDLRQQLSRLSLTPAATTNADAGIAARERELVQLRSEVELLNKQVSFLKTNSANLPAHDMMTEADQQRILGEIQAAAADLDKRAKCCESNMQNQHRQRKCIAL
ncbi:MAG: hypothetical protein KVP17_000474 [Porospora cf. gigantea B]|uniref:uncharacterized protein n=1 Tax=Porospora cf. gigantea B TaxID=2853592 RepID=UPI003571866D|nr:MAG: hypothetical protein KVP17_000474 [Porospora cf. gigantea B]